MSNQTELVVLNNTQVNNVQTGGLGIDPSSPLFKLKPATINIVQPNSQVGTKGHLRINETGQEFEEMELTLLKTPTASRRYYIGQAGQLNRIPENLMCFSFDLTNPHKDAKIPQAMSCASCSKNMDLHANWETWNKTRNKADMPPCEQEYYSMFIDKVFKMPLRMFLRSKAKGPFEVAMENITRMLKMRIAQGVKPNIFDVTFKMGTREIVTGKFKSYIPTFYDFAYTTDQDREGFGAIFNEYVNQQQAQAVQQLAAAAQSTANEVNQSVDSVVTEGEYVDGDGDIVV